jgi:hypothetical protein
MVMMMYDWFRRFGTERPVYGLMHPCVWKAVPRVADLVAETGAVVAHPKMALAALRKGASVLVYPVERKMSFDSMPYVTKSAWLGIKLLSSWH